MTTRCPNTSDHHAKFVTWQMQVLLAPASCYGDPVTATKNGETRYVPMIPELGQMLAELRKERARAAPLKWASRQPRLPQAHWRPSGTAWMCPMSPALPVVP